MVRLFIPEGESQHTLTRIRPGGPTQPDFIAAPWVGTLFAAGWTGLLAIGGRSQPGTFIKSAAIFGVFGLSWQAAGLYGRRELNRGVFKMEKIEPQPGKLWKRTKYWTVEDATLCGGALGIATVLNRRAVPGSYGFSRYLGAAMIGCGLGYVIGKDLLGDSHPELIGEFNMIVNRIGFHSYERLKQNIEAQASLSRVGKLALEYHTSPHIQNLTPAVGRMSGMSAGSLDGTPLNQSPLVRRTAEIEHSPISATFVEGELDGPDIERGHRAYKDNIQSRDESSIQGRLERINSIKNKLEAEHKLAWKFLQNKENEFYGHMENDHEKKILRYEVQLLNRMCLDLTIRCSVLAYQEADGHKQLEQMKQAGKKFHTITSQENLAKISLQTHDSPPFVTEKLRVACSIEEERLGVLEQSISMYRGITSETDPGLQERLNLQKRYAEDLRNRLEAGNRLLKWYEEQVRKPDE